MNDPGSCRSPFCCGFAIGFDEGRFQRSSASPQSRVQADAESGSGSAKPRRVSSGVGRLRVASGLCSFDGSFLLRARR